MNYCLAAFLALDTTGTHDFGLLPNLFGEGVPGVDDIYSGAVFHKSR